MQKNIILIDDCNEKIFDNLSEECYILSTSLPEKFCVKFINIATETQKIVLFYGENAVDFVKKYGADGIVADIGCEKIKEKMLDLRKKLGKGKFVGLFTRNRRHESMIVSEVEPDFIIFKIWNDGFEKVQELTDWYNDFFVIQSAVWPMEKGVDVSNIKTDFVVKLL